MAKEMTFQVIDIHFPEIDQVIEEVLALNRSSIQTSGKISETLKENGFLSLPLTNEDLIERLKEECQIIIARHQEQLVGYLILSEPNRYLNWIKKAERIEIISPLFDGLKDKKIKILTQIAILPSFAKQGIGKQLVNFAKELSPEGLLTTISYQPITNHASLKFFAKQAFLHVATAHFLGVSSRGVYIEFWKANMNEAKI